MAFAAADATYGGFKGCGNKNYLSRASSTTCQRSAIGGRHLACKAQEPSRPINKSGELAVACTRNGRMGLCFCGAIRPWLASGCTPASYAARLRRHRRACVALRCEAGRLSGATAPRAVVACSRLRTSARPAAIRHSSVFLSRSVRCLVQIGQHFLFAR